MGCETQPSNDALLCIIYFLSYFVLFIIVLISGEMCLQINTDTAGWKLKWWNNTNNWKCNRSMLRVKTPRKHSLCSSRYVNDNGLFSCSWQAAKLPMSIIIVGVGQAEFDGEKNKFSGENCLMKNVVYSNAQLVEQLFNWQCERHFNVCPLDMKTNRR